MDCFIVFIFIIFVKLTVCIFLSFANLKIDCFLLQHTLIIVSSLSLLFPIPPPSPSALDPLPFCCSLEKYRLLSDNNKHDKVEYNKVKTFHI